MLELLLFAALAIGLYVAVYYTLIEGRFCCSPVTLKGKTVVVTGGNTGIGKATAMDLAERGARVILACRSKERGEAAAYDIRTKSGNNEVLFMPLDLASLKSVRAFAEAFLKSEPRLDILINNAGVATGLEKISDGSSFIFRINHLGHFLLTNLLLDRLKQCTPSRVVIVASVMYKFGKLDFSRLNSPSSGFLQQLQAYSNSKLCNVLFARELANKLEGTNITCYAVHPGVVNTDLSRSIKLWQKLLYIPIANLFLRTPMSGAQTSIYCAVQEEIEKFSGRYFADCRVQEVKPHARNDGMAKKLWEVSEKMVGLAT
ncbi:dehydrogenase/reductase SDR family member 13b.1 [Latimeria chalumnae]|uniref:Dehydrogenase/reductase 13 n=1 Tax=Latimeria chalumnae TaxID=7897 RepID=H3AXM0_LATCH|nr:PREDICTED: dehydrogenase/reductase SDR family member 13 [Latimeria chalumnae]|eukprot:XP_006002401.1 PREDICTED: dehydrogenase/reductase SDR family member 13 [Latimeria chalumnae]